VATIRRGTRTPPAKERGRSGAEPLAARKSASRHSASKPREGSLTREQRPGSVDQFDGLQPGPRWPVPQPAAPLIPPDTEQAREHKALRAPAWWKQGRQGVFEFDDVTLERAGMLRVNNDFHGPRVSEWFARFNRDPRLFSLMARWMELNPPKGNFSEGDLGTIRGDIVDFLTHRPAWHGKPADPSPLREADLHAESVPALLRLLAAVNVAPDKVMWQAQDGALRPLPSPK